MRIHVLKTWSPFFEDTRDGHKPWEIRENDRNYAVGDFLVLRQFTPTGLRDPNLRDRRHPSGRWGKEYVVVKVKYIARDVNCPILPNNTVGMTTEDVTDREFLDVMNQVLAENAGGIWTGVRELGVR